MANNEPIEAHPNGRQVLLDSWLGVNSSKVFNIRGNDNWFEIIQGHSICIAPRKEIGQRSVVRFACVAVANDMHIAKNATKETTQGTYEEDPVSKSTDPIFADSHVGA